MLRGYRAKLPRSRSRPYKFVLPVVVGRCASVTVSLSPLATLVRKTFIEDAMLLVSLCSLIVISKLVVHTLAS